ncbi:hypothetical protein BRARA_D02776 [Brassica rapa]|uniref:F-box domain-containing protein n=2 Tax=Brassica TaxID=3705 RepID=M4FDY1_BRACM|nr:F-box protein DOR-like [Brassica rapa]XP_013640023.1 F-box protein DOR [Brassica napus]RID67707.1 hypothetical protein BRARA_D02776 [Brassica rapa]CAF2303355.1 unnamed protein product [Brassica napus]CDY37077.1 BnaA04g26550D [Brassica napus]
MEKSRRRKDRKTTSLDTGQHSSLPPLLPMELMMDIFSRLSLKSIAICRCVSKQWGYVLGHPDFRDLRLARSQARPCLLFACFRGNKLFFLSSPQPQSQSPDDEMFAADHHMSFSFTRPVKDISTSVSGFVCVSFRGYQSGRQFMADESVVCNPSTGQSFTIPRMKTMKRTGGIRFFGYDLVEKHHKVLAMIRPPGHGGRTVDHQVLTLLGGRTEKATWRMAECGIPCASSRDIQSLCINGVFYYIELVSDWGLDSMIICFDVTSEKFSSVKFARDLYPVRRNYPGRLLDFNGKLALVPSDSLRVTSKCIVTWVLQDSEWSKLVYILPPMWKVVVGPKECLEIVGVTGPNEFVMSPIYSSDPFHVYYCNFEKKTVKRVVIQGMGAFGSGRRYYVRTCLNHVEDLKHMEL